MSIAISPLVVDLDYSWQVKNPMSFPEPLLYMYFIYFHFISLSNKWMISLLSDHLHNALFLEMTQPIIDWSVYLLLPSKSKPNLLDSFPCALKVHQCPTNNKKHIKEPHVHDNERCCSWFILTVNQCLLHVYNCTKIINANIKELFFKTQDNYNWVWATNPVVWRWMDSGFQSAVQIQISFNMKLQHQYSQVTLYHNRGKTGGTCSPGSVLN